jgi:hypothetical protein
MLPSSECELKIVTSTCCPVGPIFKGQEVFLTLEDGTDRSPRNVGKKLLLNAV